MTGNGRSKVRKFLTGCSALGALVGVYCFATVGVSGLMMAATDTAALAAHGGGHGGGHGGHGGGHMGHGGGHMGHGHMGHGHAGHGHMGHGHGGHGHGRHFWHGRWWGYGEGPCWRWTPAGYVWVCN